MSMLIEGSDGVMVYVVGDEREKQLRAAFPTIQQASKGLKALQDSGQTDLVLHNITHPKCPEWITEIVLADADYCARMATNTQQRADGLRRQAEALLAEVERLERVARRWGGAKDKAAMSRTEYRPGDVIAGAGGLFVVLGRSSDPWFCELGGSLYASNAYGPGPGRAVVRPASDSELLAIHAAAAEPIRNEDAMARAAECRVRAADVLEERGVPLDSDTQLPEPGRR